MGAHDETGRELPDIILEKACLIVEDKPTAMREAGEVHREAEDLTQMFQKDLGRLKRVQTVFSSTGHAYLDLLTAAHLLGRNPSQSHYQKLEGHQPTTTVREDQFH